MASTAAPTANAPAAPNAAPTDTTIADFAAAPLLALHQPTTGDTTICLDN